MGALEVIPVEAEGWRVHWTAEADAIVRRLSPVEATRRLRCSKEAVYARRHVLGVEDGRRRG